MLLSASNGKILWQTWRDREPGFSEIRELGFDRPSEILKPLVPPRPLPPEPRMVPLPPLPQRWYQRRGVQLGVVATLVAAIVGGYVWAHYYHEADRPWNPDITGFESAAGGRP